MPPKSELCIVCATLKFNFCFAKSSNKLYCHLLVFDSCVSFKGDFGALKKLLIDPPV